LSQSIDTRFEKECNVLHALNPGVESVIVIEASGLLVLKWTSAELDTEFTSSYVREFLSLVKMTTNHYGIGEPIGVMLEGGQGFFLVFRTNSGNSIVILIKEETTRSTLRYRLMKDFSSRVEDILVNF
jgi:predicted regulator of Ras-like GTPase activity (Roadblock/LC7/MglB family)